MRAGKDACALVAGARLSGRSLARACRALEGYDPRRALMLAERLEVWLQFALFRLVADIGQLDTARAEACAQKSQAQKSHR